MKGLSGCHIPNAAYRENYEATFGRKEHGSTSGAAMSDTMSGLSWEMGQVAAELFATWNAENQSWNGYVSNDTIDIPHPYEDERL